MNFYSTIGLLLSLALSVAGAQASMVTLDGNNVQYSFDSDDVGSFGNWSLSATGQTLEFVPSDSSASVLGKGLSQKSETLVITVTAKPGYFVNGASLYEQGFYERWGRDPAALAATGVDVSGSFEIGQNRTDLNADTALDQGTTVPQGPDSIEWSMERNLTVGTLASFTISLSNSLFAWSFSSDALAAIHKTFTTVTAQTTPVPLPSSFSLLGIAIAAMGVIAHRSSRRTGLRAFK